MENNILKYTDYKKQQALWLQREDEKRTNWGTNTEQFCIQCYSSYLRLIGYNNDAVFSKINEYIKNIGTYHIATNKEFYNTGYDEKVAENIEELMDSLILAENN
jgi:hypothetical protein